MEARIEELKKKISEQKAEQEKEVATETQASETKHDELGANDK